MDWILLDLEDARGRRLDACRLADGHEVSLLAQAQARPFAPALDPTGRLIAATVQLEGAGGRADSQIALLDLERGVCRWLKQSRAADWHLGAIAFADSGERLAAEGSVGTLAATSIFVFDLGEPAFERQKLTAGAGSPDRTACHSPCFAAGGRQVFYLRRTPGGGCQIDMIDLDRPGTSAATLPVEAPSKLMLGLTDAIRIDPTPGLAFCPVRKRLYFAHGAAGRHRLAWKALTGQAPHLFWRAHGQISGLWAAADGSGAAYVADGQLWWADVELDDVIALVPEQTKIDPTLVRLAADPAWILIGGHEGDGAVVR
ncbi:MAG: hypothetical protein KC620_19385, partial [Myxococcales bacterium]|nr:hypothetical protein [Myxococcales bacterium]